MMVIFMELLLLRSFSFLLYIQPNSSLGSLFMKEKKEGTANASYQKALFPSYYILGSMHSVNIYIKVCLDVRPKKYVMRYKGGR